MSTDAAHPDAQPDAQQDTQPDTHAIVDAMQSALKDAMRARDRIATTALRTALAAIANAEAPPIDSAPLEVRGELVQHERAVLTADDVAAIVRHQITDREATIAQYLEHGRTAEADVLRAEADVLERVLASTN